VAPRTAWPHEAFVAAAPRVVIQSVFAVTTRHAAKMHPRRAPLRTEDAEPRRGWEASRPHDRRTRISLGEHHHGILQRLRNVGGVPRAHGCELVHNRPILLLEEVEGEPLSKLVGQQLELTRFLMLAISLTSTLGEIHRCGVIHKALKPSNIILTPTGGPLALAAPSSLPVSPPLQAPRSPPPLPLGAPTPSRQSEAFSSWRGDSSGVWVWETFHSPMPLFRISRCNCETTLEFLRGNQFVMMNSTRRFSLRPSGVSFDTTGRDGPWPRASRREPAMPRWMR
jgi:serine/threonine protein kinase